jgi:hypothetical protein
MRVFLCLVAIVFVWTGNALSAEIIHATTDDGKKVILKQDGTWAYAKPHPVKMSGKAFEKPATSTKVLKSKKGFYEIWYDPSKWTPNHPNNPEAEFEFRHSSGDAYGMSIAERLAMPMATLRQVAINNAKNAAPDLKVVQQGERIVNGTKVTWMKMNGTIEGIKFTYYGYYWTGSSGSLQLVMYTGQNLFNEYKKDFDAFLNGLVITKR